MVGFILFAIFLVRTSEGRYYEVPNSRGMSLEMPGTCGGIRTSPFCWKECRLHINCRGFSMQWTDRAKQLGVCYIHTNDVLVRSDDLWTAYSPDPTPEIFDETTTTPPEHETTTTPLVDETTTTPPVHETTTTTPEHPTTTTPIVHETTTTPLVHETTTTPPVHETTTTTPEHPTTTTSTACPLSFVQSSFQSSSTSGECYLVESTKQTWTEAKIHCESQGAHLVEIMTENENNFVKSIINDVSWLGVHDTQDDHFWHNSGKLLKQHFTNWAPDEPGDKCVYMNTDGLWVTEKCETQFSFVCQKEKQ